MELERVKEIGRLEGQGGEGREGQGRTGREGQGGEGRKGMERGRGARYLHQPPLSPIPQTDHLCLFGAEESSRARVSRTAAAHGTHGAHGAHRFKRGAFTAATTTTATTTTVRRRRDLPGRVQSVTNSY